MPAISDDPHISADGKVPAEQSTADPPPAAYARSAAPQSKASERLKTCVNYTDDREVVMVKRRDFLKELGIEAYQMKWQEYYGSVRTDKCPTVYRPSIRYAIMPVRCRKRL